MTFNRETEVRKLTLVARYGLVQILDAGTAWKQVMALVRRTPTETLPCPIKYTTRHIKMVEEAGHKQNRSCAEIFLEEWGSSGRCRPTLGDLLNLLTEAELFSAADYVAIELLKESRPARPENGPAAEVHIAGIPEGLQVANSLAPNISTDVPELNGQGEIEHILTKNMELNSRMSKNATDDDELMAMTDLLETLPLREVEDFTPQHISYSTLQAITNDFNDAPVGENGGRLLGKGAFGSVHLAIQGNELTAVKLLNKNAVNIDKQFQNEVEALLRVRHSNLLRMVAYSCDGPNYCLIYEYMSQGNLEERLSCQGRWKTPLPFSDRVKIALGTSEGLRHLHKYSDPPLVHRDVKSANILLGRELVPKLGDFGLVRLGVSGDSPYSEAVTTTVFGTSVYMAPETFQGDVSAKADVFSFGVVLLELLTGLSPYDSDGEGTDLVSYVNDICDKSSVGSLLDTRAGNWLTESGCDCSSELYLISQDCLEDKQKRPLMDFVVQKLQSLSNLIGNN